MCSKVNECLMKILLGIVLGVVVGYISYATLIPGIVTATWIAFGIASFSIIALIVLAILYSRRTLKCICRKGDCLLGGAIGTIIATIILLSITISINSIATAILIGFGVFFLTITLTSLTEIVLCLLKTACECRE